MGFTSVNTLLLQFAVYELYTVLPNLTIDKLLTQPVIGAAEVIFTAQTHQQVLFYCKISLSIKKLTRFQPGTTLENMAAAQFPSGS